MRDIASGEEHAIAFDEEAYALGLDAGYEFDTDTIRFTYSSMTTPAEVYDYDLGTRERVLRKRQEVPSGHDPARYVTRRLFARASDGEDVPISLLHRRDLALDGSAPCLLYGYGAYGSAMPAALPHQSVVARRPRLRVSPSRMCAAAPRKAGAGICRANAENKPNTFGDFIACRGSAGRGRLHRAEPHRRSRRQRRRHAHGRRRQPAA